MKTQLLEEIASVVSEVCEVPVERIRSHCKSEDVVDARCIFVHFCKDYGFTNQAIMRFLHRTRTCVVDNYLCNFHVYRQQSFMLRVFCTKVADKLAVIFPRTS